MPVGCLRRLKPRGAIVGSFIAVALLSSGWPARAELRRDVTLVVTTLAVTPGHSAVSSLPLAAGFWSQEGLNVKVLPVEGSTAALQQLASGNVEFVSVGPEVLLAALEKKIPVSGYYAIVPSTIFRLVVPQDSAISNPADFKDKTIGVPSLASASYTFSRMIVASAGLNPDKDVKWLIVGVGPQAALALQRGQVQALGIWDTLQASLANRGIKLRVISAPFVDKLIGQILITRNDVLANNRETAIGVARGIARATIFAAAHPEEAVQNHWRLYPASKPQQGTEEEKMAGALGELNARLGIMVLPDWPTTPYGRISGEQWQATIDAAVQEGQIPNGDAAKSGVTNDLIKEINNFDKESTVNAKLPTH